MKQLYLCFWILFFNTVFSQDVPTYYSIPQNEIKSQIGFIDLYAGGAYGYVDGFAGGVCISYLYKNVLCTLGFVSDNEQGGLEYVDNSLIPLNYYKHYRIDNIPVMIGMYHSFRSVSFSASSGLSLCMYSEYVDVNTFSIFNSNASEIKSNSTIGFPFAFDLKLFSKKEDPFVGYGLKLFGNLGKYKYTGLALVISIGNYK